MDNEIIKYLSRYMIVSKELEDAINASEFVKSYKKGTILLEEGEIANECYFIIKGCIRSYYVNDGNEITTDIFTEDQSVTPSAYGKKMPSDYYVECVEDTVAGVGTPELEIDFFQKFPQLESLSRSFADVIISKQQDTLAEFKMASPEERYLKMLKNRPDLLQRVPLHQIASFLGIKPESLSRIRKRIINQ
ncbi:MAG: Crp/Fnr family transcriptional regulator [Imperialibacter sp.]|uniref:Crp/Fnr family transcriptional regulator n=1 Tax=Imperialibacter sp. TaxID=2038411 RepID=UPI003A878D67